MKLLSQRKSVNLMLFLALVILGVISLLAYVQIQRLVEANSWVIHTHKVIEGADKALYLVAEAESRASLYLLTRDKKNIETISVTVNKINSILNALLVLTKDNSFQQNNVKKLLPLVKDKLDLMYNILGKNLIKDKKIVLTSADNEQRLALKNQITQLLNKLIDQELLLLDARNNNSTYYAKKSNLILVVAGVLSEILFLLSILILNHYLRQKDKLEIKQLQFEKELDKKNKKLEIIQERYNFAVKGSNTGLWDWKVDTEEVYYSSIFRKMVGYDKYEFPGLLSSFKKCLHPEDHDKVFSLLDQHLKDNKIVYQVEYRLKNKNGKYCWYQAAGKAMRNKQGKPLRMAGSIIDITERKEVEMMKNEFISIVSHELRTPLTSIHGAISLLGNASITELSDEASQLLTIAKKNSERLIRLINDILDVEKIESGKIEFNLTTIKLDSLIKEAMAANQPYADKFSIKLSLSKELPNLYAKTDHDRLIQVLANLISNAIKFSPTNEMVTVEMNLKDKNTARISVKDKGEGIPEKFQSKIFQKFSQADSSTTRKQEGTGLGLSISKTLIEALGGTIDFITHKNNGTTFYFDIPILEKKNQDNINSDDLLEKIVLFIRNQTISDLLKKSFSQNNLIIRNANTVAEIEDIIKREKIDVLILDLSDIESISFIKKIRSEKKYNSLPIVVIATKGGVEQRELIMNAVNIIDWIDKTIDNNRLLQAIQILKKTIGRNLPNVLHVEDDVDLAKIVKTILAGHARIVNAESLREAKAELMLNNYDLVILDLQLPDGFSANILPLLNQKNIPVIVFSAYELPHEYISYANAILTKSKTTNEELVEAIAKIIKTKINTGDSDGKNT